MDGQFESEGWVSLGKLLPDYPLDEDLGAVRINSIELDSRKVKEGSAFIASLGGEYDGRNFIESAIASGAKAVVSEGEERSLKKVRGVPVLIEKQLKKRVSAIAANYYGHPSKQQSVIGVTGTNGKSTCVSLLTQMYEILGKKSAQIGTLGYGCKEDNLIQTGMTTPDAITCQRIFAELKEEGVEKVAMEVSSHGVTQHRVGDVCFDGAIFTNISRDHLDYHENFAAYKHAKGSLFSRKSLKYVVVNKDDVFGDEILNNYVMNSEIDKYSYSVANTKADICTKEYQLVAEGIRAKIVTPWGEGELSSKLIGRFNLYNILAVISAVCASGEPLSKVLNAVKELHPAKGRMQRVEKETSDSPSVYVDYAHTPDALENALSSIKEHAKDRLWVVFGCGGDRDKGKRGMMGEVVQRYADEIIVTTDNPRSESAEDIIRDIYSGMNSRVHVKSIADRKEAILYAVSNAKKNDCILIAGKGHENFQEVGDQKLPFDDFEIARNALESRRHNDAF